MIDKKEKNNKEEKKNIEEIDLNELEMEDLDFFQGGACDCSSCPMSCGSEVEKKGE